MTRGWPALLLLVALPGCVTDESRNAARDAYADCTMAAVKRFDDGHSDPASIAMGVAGACAGQYAQLSNTMTANMITERGQDAMQFEMKSNELRMATAAVLTYRAAQRGR